jgi:hypothetical protein
MRPGRYKMKRGGFLARHPKLKIKERKSARHHGRGEFAARKLALLRKK